MVAGHPSGIFPEYHVKTPMQLILYRPMTPQLPATFLGIHIRIADIAPVTGKTEAAEAKGIERLKVMNRMKSHGKPPSEAQSCCVGESLVVRQALTGGVL
jgi:hypothetical protein